MTSEELEGLAEGILATLDDAPPEMLHALAEGLAGADGPVQSFYLPILYAASDRDAGREDGFLAVGSLTVALKMGAFQREALLARLENAQTPLWLAVRDALVEIAEDHPRADLA